MPTTTEHPALVSRFQAEHRPALDSRRRDLDVALALLCPPPYFPELSSESARDGSPLAYGYRIDIAPESLALSSAVAIAVCAKAAAHGEMPPHVRAKPLTAHSS